MNKKKILVVFTVLILTSLACSIPFSNNLLGDLTDEIGNAVSDPGQIATLIVDGVENLGTQDNGSSQPAYDNLNYGMDQLESYRFLFMQSLQGEDEAGNATNITVVNNQEVIKSLQFIHLYVETRNDVRSLGVNELYRYGNETYLVNSDGENGATDCSLITENMDSSNNNEYELGLSSIFSNLVLGELQEQSVDMNGVITDHYLVTGVNMVNSTLTDVIADVWIAQDGGYIVRFAGRANGTGYSEIDNLNINGVVSWDYGMTDVNNIGNIPLPEVCQLATVGGINEIPVPENAYDVSQIGSMKSFTSPDASSLLADFYRSEMPVNGYSLSDETAYDDFYVLTYTKAEETIVVMISGLTGGGSDAILTIEVK